MDFCIGTCAKIDQTALVSQAEQAGATHPTTAMARPDSASKTSSGAWYTSSTAAGRAVCTP